jgi:transposase-like protein
MDNAMAEALSIADQIEDICQRLSEGDSLRKICRALDLKESSVRYWLSKDEAAFAHSTRARELGCDALADECLEIADDCTIDVQHKRVSIDTRLRLIGKWSQRYSEKLSVTKTTEVTHRYDLDNLSDGELDQLEHILANARAGQGGESPPLPAQLH